MDFVDVSDLSNPEVFRDLSKPIGALNEERLAKLQVPVLKFIATDFVYK